MELSQFKRSTQGDHPSETLSAPLQALWWDAKGDWQRAHSLVDELESMDGMAVHAYLHRSEGSAANAEYWYQRAGTSLRRETLADEWAALVEELLNRNADL